MIWTIDGEPVAGLVWDATDFPGVKGWQAFYPGEGFKREAWIVQTGRARFVLTIVDDDSVVEVGAFATLGTAQVEAESRRTCPV